MVNISASAAFALLAFWIAPLLQPACAQEVQIAAAESGRAYGSLIEELFREAGLVPVITYYPAERALRMTINGEVDAEFFRQKTAIEPIAEEVHLIGPLACTELAAFGNVRSGIILAKADDLGRYRLGAIIGNKLAAAVAQRYDTHTTLVPKVESLFHMLQAGRIDIAIESERIGLAQIGELKLEKEVVRIGPLISSVPTYLVLRRHLSDWAPRLEAAYAKLRKSGRWMQRFGDLSVAQRLPRDIALHCLGAGSGHEHH